MWTCGRIRLLRLFFFCRRKNVDRYLKYAFQKNCDLHFCSSLQFISSRKSNQGLFILKKGVNLTELNWQLSMQTMTCTNLAARLAHTCRLRPLCSRQSRHTCSCLCCWRTPGAPACIQAQAESTRWYLVGKIPTWNSFWKLCPEMNVSSAISTSYLCRCPLRIGNRYHRPYTGQGRLPCSRNTHCRRLWRE